MSHPQVRQGDNPSPLRATLYDPANPTETLDGLAIRFQMRLPGATTFKIDAPARIVNPTTREVAYDWQPGDLDTPALYYYRWKTVKPNGSVLTYPTQDQPFEVIGTGVAQAGKPFATITQAQQYVPSAQEEEPVKLQFVLEDASEIVENIAPTPNPIPDDYVRRAARAELMVFEWLWETRGFKPSRSGVIGSESYSLDFDAVRRLVKQTMGKKYAEGIKSVAVVSSFPRSRTNRSWIGNA